jgi:hypothetical protein
MSAAQPRVPPWVRSACLIAASTSVRAGQPQHRDGGCGVRTGPLSLTGAGVRPLWTVAGTCQANVTALAGASPGRRVVGAHLNVPMPRCPSTTGHAGDAPAPPAGRLTPSLSRGVRRCRPRLRRPARRCVNRGGRARADPRGRRDVDVTGTEWSVHAIPHRPMSRSRPWRVIPARSGLIKRACRQRLPLAGRRGVTWMCARSVAFQR